MESTTFCIIQIMTFCQLAKKNGSNRFFSVLTVRFSLLGLAKPIFKPFSNRKTLQTENLKNVKNGFTNPKRLNRNRAVWVCFGFEPKKRFHRFFRWRATVRFRFSLLGLAKPFFKLFSNRKPLRFRLKPEKRFKPFFAPVHTLCALRTVIHTVRTKAQFHTVGTVSV